MTSRSHVIVYVVYHLRGPGVASRLTSGSDEVVLVWDKKQVLVLEFGSPNYRFRLRSPNRLRVWTSKKTIKVKKKKK